MIPARRYHAEGAHRSGKAGNGAGQDRFNDKGMALCAEGTELSANVIDRLMKMHVSSLTLKGHPVDLGIETKTGEQRVKELSARFSMVQGDSIMDMLKTAIEQAILSRQDEDDRVPQRGDAS